MAEKSLDIVAEKIERLDIRRNTSNQIISYTLPDDSEKLYGVLRITGTRTAFPIADFNRVIYSRPSELVNPIPLFEINIVSKATIDIRGLINAPTELRDYAPLPTSPVVASSPTSFGVTTLPTSNFNTLLNSISLPASNPYVKGLNALSPSNQLVTRFNALNSSNPYVKGLNALIRRRF